MAGSDDEDGLTILLSPVQFAAVLTGQSITQAEGRISRLHNRLDGALTLIGGAVELTASAALLLTPDPTLATKVGGWALAVHGSDTTSTGLVEVWTGRGRATLTAQAVAAAARNIGYDPEASEAAGTAVDILVPLAAGGLGVARAIEIRAGRISLAVEEAAGGHTIAKHVGKTEAELRARLAAERGIAAASSFTSVEVAEAAVSDALRANARDIAQWASSTTINNVFRVPYATGGVVGYCIQRSVGLYQPASKILVVLRKAQRGNKLYFVLTAFPTP